MAANSWRGMLSHLIQLQSVRQYAVWPNGQVKESVMVDDLKHLDVHSEEIRELVETLIQNNLLEAVNANQYCSKCVAVALLEWATFAATSAGATVGEMTSAVANGAVMAEEETERVEAEVTGETRH